MQTKVVVFGNLATKQVKCPKCEQWQFEDKKCCECFYDFSQENEVIYTPIEYRTEISPTWRDRVKDTIKKKVYERDEFACQYCGNWCYDSWITDPRQLTIDHIIPRTGGGNNDIDNLITCCRECNGIKGNKHFKTYDEAREYIIKRKKDYETI